MHGRGACVAGDMHFRGACVAGGCAWKDGMCGRGDMHGGGHAWHGGGGMCGRGDMHGRVACIAGKVCVGGGGHAWQGACVAGGGHAWQGGAWQGGMCGRGACMTGGMHDRYYEIRSMSRCILPECILVVIVNGNLQECLETRSSSIRFLTRKRIKIIETGRLLSVVTSSRFFCNQDY